MIEGVSLLALATFEDARGGVLRMVRSNDPGFAGFGEIYFSTVLMGAVKAWKRHRRMVLNLAVPSGAVLFAIHDDRPDSPTRGQVQLETLGRDRYRLLQIPPGLWFGFKGLAEPESVVANCASILHDPREADTLPLDSERIPYRWEQS